MTIDSRALIASGVEIGQAVFMEESQPVDLEFFGRRYLQSGNVETDTSKFDTNIFTAKTEINLQVTSPAMSSTSVKGVAFGAGLYVLVGAGGIIETSPDLVNWTSRSNGFGGELIYFIKFIEGKFIAGGAGGIIETSTDGITWVTATSNISGTPTISNVTYNGVDEYIITGDSVSATSPDGFTWTEQTSAGSGFNWGIAFGAGLYVTVGNLANIWTTPDGAAWTQRTDPFGSSHIRGVAYGNGVFVACGDSGKVATSPDGVAWSLLPSIGIANATTVIFSSGVFYLCDVSGRLMKSTDGTSWIELYSDMFGSFNDATALVTTEGGMVIVSDDINDIVSIELVEFAGSPIAHAENGENQYIRIS